LVERRGGFTVAEKHAGSLDPVGHPEKNQQRK
jgi:hypothetical protein